MVGLGVFIFLSSGFACIRWGFFLIFIIVLMLL